MPRFALGSWIAVMLLACGFDTGGVASGSADVGNVGESSSADDGQGSGPGPGSGQDASGDDAATNPATGDPTAADGDLTTDPTTDPTAEATTDLSAGSSSGALDPTMGTSGMVDPTTGVMEEDPPYPSCSGPAMCLEASEFCVEYADFDKVVIASLCVPPCDVDADCPPPATGTAMPICVTSNFCRLSCDAMLTCPDGMSCYQLTGGIYRCAYML